MKKTTNRKLVFLSVVLMTSVMVSMPFVQKNDIKVGEEVGAFQGEKIQGKALMTTRIAKVFSTSASDGIQIGSIPANTKLKAEEKVGDWYKVSYEGDTGFISGKDIVEEQSVKIASTSKFPDVKDFEDEIDYLTSLGIIHGHTDGTFKPLDNLKRIHAVQMVLREMGITKFDAPNPGFADIKPGAYGYDEVAKAVQLGFIHGSTNNKGQKVFNPNGTLTRGQMAKILTEAYAIEADNNISFKDVSSGHWTKEYVSRLATAGVTAGYPDGSFKPDTVIQRQHFSAFMARHLNPEFKVTTAQNPTPTPAPKPVVEQKLMSRPQAEAHVSSYMAKDANGYSLMSGSGRYSVSVNFPTNGSGKAHLSVDGVSYISGVEIKPEDFGQRNYDEAKAHLAQMNSSIKVYAETQFGMGSKEANTLMAEVQKMTLEAPNGQVKKLTLQGVTITIAKHGISTNVYY